MPPDPILKKWAIRLIPNDLKDTAGALPNPKNLENSETRRNINADS